MNKLENFNFYYYILVEPEKKKNLGLSIFDHFNKFTKSN